MGRRPRIRSPESPISSYSASLKATLNSPVEDGRRNSHAMRYGLPVVSMGSKRRVDLSLELVSPCTVVCDLTESVMLCVRGMPVL